MSFLRRLSRRSGRRGKPAARPSNPSWHTATGGPLKGQKLLLDLDAAPWQTEMRDGRFDAFIYEALGGLGSLEGKIAWDIGAHVGYHTLCLASLVGKSGRSAAFEPNPYNLERLRANVAQNPDLAERIKVFDLALSDQRGEASFVFNASIDDGASSGSGLETAFANNPEIDIATAPRIQVALRTADEIVASGESPAPDVLKIDVEGAEHRVLEGALGILRTRRPVLIIEVHNITAMFHTQKLLTNLGYETTVLDPAHSTASRCHILGVHGPTTH